MLIRSKGHDQKQPSRGVLWRRCSENIRQIYRRTLCQSATSIKLQGNFIEITLRHRCSPVTVLHICIFTKHLFLKTLLGSCFCIMHHIYFNDNICYIYIYIYILIYMYIYIYIYIYTYIYCIYDKPIILFIISKICEPDHFGLYYFLRFNNIGPLS